MNVLAALLLGCCALVASAAGAAGFDAKYRLLHNDKLVGQTLFRARIADGAYTMEAFTIPSGSIARDAPEHEVLEISEGSWHDAGPVPGAYVYHLRDGRGDHLFEQVFDWAEGKLRLSYADQTEAAELEPGTQDRLSYLLQLAEAVRDGFTEFAFAVAEPEATVAMRFRALLRETLEVGAGKAEAIGVECFTTGDTPDRTIWIVPEWQHVPALIERAVEDGRVRMELLSWEAH